MVKQWLLCKKAHTLLVDVLTLSGSHTFDPLWNQFRHFELIETRRATKACQDDDYDLLNTGELTTFCDFWNFVERLLKDASKGLDAHVNFFVKLLQADLKSRLDNKEQVQASIFVKILNSRSKHFNKYLDTFPDQDIHLTGLVSDLLNMLIMVSYFDYVGTVDHLTTQMHKKSIDAIYRHILMVSKYCMSVSSITAFSQQELVVLYEALDEFKTKMYQLTDNKGVDKISWSIQLTMLHFS
ncbi:uncharacterized protein B0P05DRAFT_638107 [Gilbertella persicaria]|uniref:uncharacterized protein n=1 Tax=Gilbertella persicaria TaxID=101096 RepID=UPI00221EA9D1|nr:uncharacterized protein B0P05DRAFT_638107 [Gilbertella persicaria]KAI8076576.1 hypothetical protein B0P05DRAFT_638107 [Gilbertella persicaria]